MLPAGSLRVSAYHVGKLRFARATHRGCAEGRSPFAEGLGVSPNSFLYTPKIGGSKGVENGLLGQPTRGLKESPEMTSGLFRWQGRNLPPTISGV